MEILFKKLWSLTELPNEEECILEDKESEKGNWHSRKYMGIGHVIT